MNNNRENLILGLPRRPRGNNRNLSTTIGALTDFVLNKNIGNAGNVLLNQPMSLEWSVRNYFAQKNLSVIFFYRSPKSIEVLFKSHNQFWTVKSSVPKSLTLEMEDIEDWLYGNLIKKELPKKLRQIRNSLKI